MDRALSGWTVQPSAPPSNRPWPSTASPLQSKVPVKSPRQRSPPTPCATNCPSPGTSKTPFWNTRASQRQRTRPTSTATSRSEAPGFHAARPRSSRSPVRSSRTRQRTLSPSVISARRLRSSLA